MLDPRELYELAGELPEVGRPVLVQALTGFVDAGNATYLAREHLLGALEPRLVATFDADQPPLGTQFGPDGDGSKARVITMAPGDALVLVTDGFFECRNPAGELRGIDRLGDRTSLA